MPGLPGIDGPPVSAATETRTVNARLHILKGKKGIASPQAISICMKRECTDILNTVLLNGQINLH